MKRSQALAALRDAGYHDDKRNFMRLYVENRVAFAAAQRAFSEGRRMRAAGVKCNCIDCKQH